MLVFLILLISTEGKRTEKNKNIRNSNSRTKSNGWWLQSEILTTAPVAEVHEKSKKVQILEEREEIKLVTGHKMRIIQ